MSSSSDCSASRQTRQADGTQDVGGRAPSPQQRILITGGRGRIGSAIHALYPGADVLDIDRCDLRAARPDLAVYDTVVHLASSLYPDFASARDNMDIAFNVLDAARIHRVRRLIWASSVTAEERQIAFPVTWYGRAKKAQEAFLDAWCAEDPARVAVALRFGHFCEGSHPPPEHELLRLHPSGLAFWMGRALAHDAPGLTIWNAMGATK